MESVKRPNETLVRVSSFPSVRIIHYPDGNSELIFNSDLLLLAIHLLFHPSVGEERHSILEK